MTHAHTTAALDTLTFDAALRHVSDLAYAKLPESLHRAYRTKVGYRTPLPARCGSP
jgi:hypothetical protein